MLMLPTTADPERTARALYWMGWAVSDIAEHLGKPRTTVQSWKDRGEWDKASALTRMETALDARFTALVHKEPKTGGDFKELDLFGRQAERFARIRRYEAPGGNEADLNPAVEARNAGPKRKAKRNEFSEEQIEELRKTFLASLFEFQRTWRNSADERT